MKKVKITVIDCKNKVIKRAEVEKQDIVALVNNLEDKQIMVVRSIDSSVCFIKSKKVTVFQEIGSLRSAIESL